MPPRTKNVQQGEGSSSRPRGKSTIKFVSRGDFSFLDGGRAQKFDDLLNRSVRVGKQVDFDAIHEFFPDFHEIFERLGWTHYLSFQSACVEILVKQFYANLDYDPDSFTITSFVNGTHIKFNKLFLRDLLCAPLGDVDVFGLTWENIEFRDGHDLAFARSLLFKENESEWPIHAVAFTDMAAIVGKIVQANILPKFGERDKIREDTQPLVFAILAGYPICLPSLILHVMNAAPRSPRSLPYGSLIHHILLHFKVPIPVASKLTREATFAKRTLSLMGLTPDSIRRRRGGPHLPPPVAQDEVDANDDTPPVDIHSYIHDELLDMQCFLQGEILESERRTQLRIEESEHRTHAKLDAILQRLDHPRSGPRDA